MSYSNKEVTSMLQQNKSSQINDTVADIIVAEVRAYFRKTGDKTRTYDEFTVKEIADRCGGREAFFKVSTWGVAQALNSVKGIKARYDDTSFQIGPSEWLPLIHIELD